MLKVSINETNIKLDDLDFIKVKKCEHPPFYEDWSSGYIFSFTFKNGRRHDFWVEDRDLEGIKFKVE